MSAHFVCVCTISSTGTSSLLCLSSFLSIPTLGSYFSDPESNVDFAVTLHQSKPLIEALFEGLRDNGVLVAQLGESPENCDAADELDQNGCDYVQASWRSWPQKH